MLNKKQIFRALEAPAQPLLKEQLEKFEQTRGSIWCQTQAARLRERATAYAAAPTPPLPYSLFNLYWESGDRSAYQAAYFERRARLLCFALMTWLEPQNTLWLHALEDILWEICAEPFWCIPAHFMADGDEPLPFEAYAAQLDLFSAETGFALAECLALNETRLAQKVVRQVDLQLERRIFEPFLNGGVFYRFEAMANNWSGVCGSAIGGAALYRMKDHAALTSLLHRCCSCLSVYLDSFGEDGVCVEGADYWTYGFGFFTCFADLLHTRTAGAIDLLGLEKAAAIAKSQQYFYLQGDSTVSFADGHDRTGFRMGLSCYLQRRFCAAALPEQQYAAPVLGDACYRFCLALRDFLWYDPAASFGLPPESVAWLPDAQWFLCRTPRLTLAAKAGHNGESHNHNDSGSFMLCKAGVPLVCDLGAGLYDAAYFGPGRYELFINASRSHNLPLPAGCEQKFGPQYAARVLKVETGPAPEPSLCMELAACYACPALVSLRRTLACREAGARLELTDEFTYSKPCSTEERFVSHAPIRLEAGVAVFERKGQTLRLGWDEERFEARLDREEYDAYEGGRKTAYLLRLVSRTPGRQASFEAWFE